MKFKSDIEVQAGLKDSSGAAGTSGQVLSSTASGVSWINQSGFVPYIGATQDVDLGANQLKADSLAVSTTSVEPVNVGEIVWNAIDGTFDMGLIGGVTLQAGQEMHVYGKATQAIANGDAVMFAGVQGDHILIAKADPIVINANPEYFIGISTQALATNDFGYITVFGNVRGLNTTAYTLGSVLYYDSVTSLLGLLTPTEPVAPYAKIEVAAVVRVHATQGILLVRPHVMPKLSDIQDVYAPNPFNNDVLFWNSSNSRYETNTIPGILGYNPERQLTFTSPLSRVSNTISIPQSTATVDGFLSSTDWTTFNSKQGALNGTGFVKVSGTTITYDNSVYALDNTVVKLTGDQGILGIKSFNHVNGSVENFTTRLNYFFDNGIIRSDVTPLETINNLTSQSIFKVDKDGNTTANSFIKIGGNSTQYLKADGSVSTAMNSRIEVNFTATSGQTTFTTPYEVGQIDVYYNGSKLNPSEFTATNGTTVVLAQAATLNAQISIVKYVAALSTTAIRNETTFTATSGQTTFSVNYTVGQLDVFYNGSKLNVSEFTATNGTSVVLGFACQAGESVVFVSYVNQVSGASGTANRVAKFTGVATLGDSQITDNGNNLGIGTTTFVYGPKVAINSVGQNTLSIQTTDSVQGTNGSVLYIGTGATTGNTYGIIRALSTGGTGSANLVLQPSGNVLIGTTTDNGAKLQVDGIGYFSGRLSLGNGTVSNFNAINIGSGVYTNTAAITIGASNPTGGVVSPIITLNAPDASYNYAVRGGMYYNGSNLQMEFRTTSDYRVKEDLIEDFNAMNLLDKIKIYDHKWIGASGRSYSVIAHELQNVIPYLVSGQKDAILENGSMDLQSVDYSKLVPLLVKAIQEQQAQIKELQDEIISLKNK
jgi:hypothetical protein